MPKAASPRARRYRESTDAGILLGASTCGTGKYFRGYVNAQLAKRLFDDLPPHVLFANVRTRKTFPRIFNARLDVTRVLPLCKQSAHVAKAKAGVDANVHVYERDSIVVLHATALSGMTFTCFPASSIVMFIDVTWPSLPRSATSLLVCAARNSATFSRNRSLL